MAKINIMAIQANEPKALLEDYVWTVYGRPKVGKTTLFYKLVKAKYGDMSKGLLVAFEKGYQTLKGIFAQDVDSWEDFVELVNQLIENREEVPFRLLALDTIDKAYELVCEYIVKKERIKRRDNNIKTIGDIPYGAGYDLVSTELSKQFTRLQKGGYGLFFITHDKDKKFESRDGISYDKTTVSLAGRARDVVVNMSDFIIFIENKIVEVDGEKRSERVIYFRAEGSDLEAGSRFQNITPCIPYDEHMFLEAFEEAVLNEHGEDADLDKIRKEQAEKREQEIKEFIESEQQVQQEENTVTAADLHKEIKALADKIEDKETLKKTLKQHLGVINYTKVDDVEKLQAAIEAIKSL